MNLKMFYCVEDRNTYAADTYKKQAALALPLFTFFAVMFYVIGRNLRLDEITFSVAPIIIFSIAFGTVMGVAFSLYTDKKNYEYFAAKEAFNITKKEQKGLAKQARRITWIYSGFRMLLILLAVIEPFLFMEVKDLILLAGYFVIWFALGYSILQFKIHERRKMIKNLIFRHTERKRNEKGDLKNDKTSTAGLQTGSKESKRRGGVCGIS